MKTYAVPNESCIMHYTDSFWRWGVRFILLKASAIFGWMISHLKKRLDTKNLEGNNYPALYNLRTYKPITSNFLLIFKNIFQRKYQEKISRNIVALDLSFTLFDDAPVEKNLDRQAIIAIPLIVKGVFLDHIINIIYNRKENRMEFYDSKGQTLGDRIHNKVWGKNKNLAQIVASIWKKYRLEGQKKITVFSNTNVHQYNGHDCGPRVMHDVMQAMDGVSYNDRFNAAIIDPRKKLLDEIKTEDFN